MDISLTIQELTGITQPSRVGGKGVERIRGIASLKEAAEGDLSFLGNRKYRKEVALTKASVVLVPEDFEAAPPPGQIFFWQKNPSLALALICQRIEQRLWSRPVPGIHTSTVIAKGAVVPDDVCVGPFCVIEEGAVIGSGTVLQAQCYVGRRAKVGRDCHFAPRCSVHDFCEIGDRVRLHSGVVIGSDGYGYAEVDGRHEKLPQIGNVVVGPDVEIGANTTIDRARFDRTEIGAGTKIDNLVQIGHNVIIGRHCCIVAQVGIAGSTRIGDYVMIGGQAGIVGHLHIGDRAMIAAQSGVPRDIPANTYVSGAPAIHHLLDQRLIVLRSRLPELFREVEGLRKEVKKLSIQP